MNKSRSPARTTGNEDDSSRQAYLTRLHAAVDHVKLHLADELDLRSLAAVAHFSPWHFHRVFHAMMGETVADHVRRRRLEACAAHLVAAPSETVASIAKAVGLGSAAVLSRQFKARFGVTPTAWRQGGHRQWAVVRRSELMQLQSARQRAAATPAGAHAAQHGIGEVTLRTFPALRVAYMRHVGPYGDPRIGQTWQRLIQWAGMQGLLDGRHHFIGIGHDSPDIALPGQCRYDACVEIGEAAVGTREVGVQRFAGGHYACMRFTGTGDEVYAAWLHLYAQWLPQSGLQPDDLPAIEAYGTSVDGDAESGRFSCELCLPVRPL